jgi:hypothetical protein
MFRVFYQLVLILVLFNFSLLMKSFAFLFGILVYIPIFVKNYIYRKRDEYIRSR